MSSASSSAVAWYMRLEPELLPDSDKPSVPQSLRIFCGAATVRERSFSRSLTVAAQLRPQFACNLLKGWVLGIVRDVRL